MKFLSYFGKSLNNSTTYPLTNMEVLDLDNLGGKIIYYLGELNIVAALTKLT
mgnify:CR=1 FL=1